MLHASGKRRNYVDRIGNVVLIAPDLDVEVLSQRVIAEYIGTLSDQLTVYSSPGDRAIRIAEWLFGSRLRLGRMAGDKPIPPKIVRIMEATDNLAVVVVRGRTGLIGHNYHYQNPSASSDLILALRDGRAPGAEHGRPLEPRGSGFWVLREGYPAHHGAVTIVDPTSPATQ